MDEVKRPQTQEETITRNVIDAAARNGVDHLVYTPVYTADRPTGVPHFAVKDVLERYLTHAAVPATVLRPAPFMDAFAAPWLREGLLGRGVLLSPIAIDAPISLHRRGRSGGRRGWSARRPRPNGRND